MRITQHDIAKKANVSRSLVGQILSGHPGAWASDETRHRILKTAREMNYHPNASARTLRTGKSRAVGMFSVADPIANSKPNLGGISVEVCGQVLCAAGYELKVKVFPDADSLLIGLSEAVRGGLCDAFFVSGSDAEQQGLLLDELGIPFVVYGRFEETHPHWLQVDYDHESMMANAVKSLADRGRSRPVMVCYAGEQSYTKRLISGFKQACATRLSRIVDEDMILRIPVDPTIEQVVSDKFDRWLTLPESIRPDSLVMGAELFAPRLIEEQLWRHGTRIGFGPDELAICGACHPPYGWLVGDYTTFDALDCLVVAREMAESIMLPLLQGKSIQQKTIRIVPSLHDLSGMSSATLKYLAAIAAKS